MKTILGLIASPRRMGNCEIMLKEISRRIAVPHELSLLRFSDFDVRPCRGCYHCLFNETRCVQDDDFNRIVAAICAADALLLAVPAYFLGPNASLKRFLDRGLALYAHLDRLWHKPAVAVGIAGIQGKEGYTLLGIESFLSLIFADNKQTRICYGALPGEVMRDDRNRQAAVELATALFGPAGAREETDLPRCPLCGGCTFRFFGKEKVRCMLCSNSGTMQFKNDVPVFDIHKDAHQLFLSKKEAADHRQWLLEMKGRYLAQKDDLKKIAAAYLKQGKWIRPEKKPG